MSIKHHEPRKLDKDLKLNYNEFASELAEAEYALGLLEGSQKKLQNSSLLISPLTAKEAAISSSIEGTQSTVSDVFKHDAGVKTEHSDIIQVVNYRSAMRFAIAELEKGRTVSEHLIKSLHETLLKETRFKGVLGAFRKGDVWIAKKAGDPIEKAIYVPPQPYLVHDYIENLLNYLESGEEGVLIKAGIAHYQFEAIHPFDDGNGRIGRLLIPLILFHHKRISQPILYISGQLEANRDEYIETLHEVDETGKIEPWLKFFFRSITKQLEETQELIEKIYLLNDKIRDTFQGNKSPHLIPFVDFLFAVPVFTVPMAKGVLQTSTDQTIKRLIALFQEEGLVKEEPYRHSRAKVYTFEPLIKIIQ